MGTSSSFLLLNVDWGQNKSCLIPAEHWKKKYINASPFPATYMENVGAESLGGSFVSMVTTLSKSKEGREQQNMRDCRMDTSVKAPDLGVWRIVSHHLCYKEKKLTKNSTVT